MAEITFVKLISVSRDLFQVFPQLLIFANHVAIVLSNYQIVRIFSFMKNIIWWSIFYVQSKTSFGGKTRLINDSFFLGEGVFPANQKGFPIGLFHVKKEILRVTGEYGKLFVRERQVQHRLTLYP